MNVLIIGGGASGLAAAIRASKAGHRVTLFEHKDRIGKKLLLTGNGRCNLTNETLAEHPERSYTSIEGSPEEIIKSIFNKFGYKETLVFFEELGLRVKKRGALLYPYSDQASAVLDVLRFQLRELPVKIITDCTIERVIPGEGDHSFTVQTKAGDFAGERLLLCCGGCAQSKTGSDGSGFALARQLGHTITDVTPGLVPLSCKGSYFPSIAGVRVHARLTLLDARGEVGAEEGELQLTDYGISGIAVMNLSNELPRCVGLSEGKCRMKIDLCPELTEKELLTLLHCRLADKRTNVMETVGEFLIGFLNKKLGERMLLLAGFDLKTPVTKMPEARLAELSALLKGWEVTIEGPRSFDKAQVTLGGVRLSELTDTLQSKLVPGLYFAGEMLDLNGPCGGYQLQLAWSTGAVAAMLM